MVSENIIKNTIISTQIQPEKTFLVTVATKDSEKIVSAEASQSELAQLVKSAVAS